MAPCACLTARFLKRKLLIQPLSAGEGLPLVRDFMPIIFLAEPNSWTRSSSYTKLLNMAAPKTYPPAPKSKYNPLKYKGEKRPEIKNDDVWYTAQGFPIKLQEVNRNEWVMLKVVPCSSWNPDGPTEEVVSFLVSNRCYT